MYTALAAATVLAVSICANVFAAVGRTPGQFVVSATGGAQYSIPVWTPPGIRGIQPKLALLYDSHLPSGIMGPGWTLSGLSMIGRCNKTYAQDGSPAPITLTAADGLCLDGNRLRTTGTGVYQTEIANFSQVTASGTAGNGPSYFTVQGKDGLTYEYGNTSDSKILPCATPSTCPTPYIWALDKVTDRNGNYMTFTYYQAGGAYVPLSIQYTATSGSASFPYVVNFNYSPLANTNPNTTKRFIAGTETLQTQQLSNVTITSSGTIVREYNLVYTVSAVTVRATLTSIQECGNPTGAGGTATDCLLPTAVQYQPGVSGVASATTPTGGSGGANAALYSVDIDGDGRKDLVFGVYNATAHTYAWYVQLATGTGYGSVTGVGLNSATILLDDLDGSGLTDIIGNGIAYKWNGTGFTQTTIPITFTSTTTFADIDGDGRPDLAVLTINGNSSTLAVYLNTSTSAGISFATTAAITQPEYLLGDTVYCLYGDNNSCSGGTVPQNSPVSHFDFNGDGRSDLLLVAYVSNSSFSGWFGYELAYNGSTFIEAGGAVLGTGTVPNPFVALNFNDDACTDLMGTTELQISQCNGSGFLDIYIPSGGVAGLAVDWDGDGRTDILANVSGSWQRYQSQGDSFATGVSTGIAVGSGHWIVTDQNGDGLDDLAFMSSSSGVIDYGLHNGAGQPPDLAISFADGFGNSATPSYVALPQASTSVFTKGAAKAYPQLAYVGPLYITSSAVLSDGIGGNYTLNYQYNQAVVNLQGRGFAGFGSRKIQDSRNGLLRYIHYNTDFPWIGFVTADGTTQSNGTKQITNYVTHLSSLALDATANNERYFAYVDTATSTQYELGGSEDGTLITTSVTSYEVPDYYGNFAVVATTLTDNDPGSPYSVNNWSTATETTITPHTSTWCLNLPTQKKVTNSTTVTGGAPITRTVAYNNPDYANCRQTEKVIEPNSATYKVVEDYGWDTNFGNFGNLHTLTVTGVGMAPRVTTINWTSNGQFPQTIVNPISQSITLGFDPNSGMKTSQTDPNYTTANPLTTTWKYDDFARKVQENRLDGTYTVWTYNDCATWGGCIIGSHALALTYSINNVGGSIQSKGTTYYDQFDRPLMANPLNLAGGRDRYEVRYDNLGRVARQAMPCTWTSDTAACPYWTTNSYDGLNRLTQSQRPISATNSTLQTTTIQYAGRTTTVIDPLSVNDGGTKKIYLVTGALAQSYDPYHYGQLFTYDSFGSLLSVADTASNALFTATYDYGIQAFQRNATDMDLDVSTAAGQHRQFTYDALGELTSWSDANGNSFSMLYDPLSRPTQRNDPDYTTYWTWGNSASSYNIGKLQSISGVDNSGAFNETYNFESKTRLWMDTLNIPQGGGINTYTTTYNATTGLPDTLQYPTAGTYQLKLQYTYANGLLKSISDFNAPTTVFWTANAANPRGQVTQETLGNGVVINRSYDAVTSWLSSLQAGVGGGAGLVNSSFGFDEVGNVTQRQNNNLGLTENFYYDDDYRLDHSTLNGTVNLQLGYDPAGTGNIAYRSDVAASQNWTYDPVKKHAFIQAGSCCLASASYDNNGNAIKRDGNIFYWSSYNQPVFIAKFNEQSQIYYGPNRKRYLASYSSNNNIYPAENTYYVGDLLEIAAGPGTPGGDYRHYIYAGNEPVAILSVASGVNTLRYVIPDHQGSYSSIVSDSSPGSVANYVSESFTPYGLRRSGETWSGPPTSGDETLINGVSRQGYTGHSADGVSMGLNYMNGRLQDALTGVFLSPDPYVSDPSNTQSFNRYSYVNNNPLTYTDPSGFDPVLDPITVVGYLGGPENPWADAAGVAVAAADVLGFSSIFGGGVPSLSPNQQLAERHGISLTTQLPEMVVEAPQLTPGFLEGFESAGGSFLFGNDATLAVTTEHSSDPNTLDQIDVNGVRYGMHGFDPIPFVPGGGALECIIMHCSGGGWALAGIGAIPFASIEGGIASAGQHLVLGLRAYGLEQTALKVGGQTLLKDPNWKASLVNALTNGSTKITVSVEGLNGSSVYSQVMQAVQKGLGAFPSPTNWELAQLYQAGRLATTTFVDGLGNILPNPF